MNNLREAEILLVEDNKADQKMIKASLAKQKLHNTLHVEASSEKALEFLGKCKNSNGQEGYPDLILLDLNMPGMGGKGFLRHIKTDKDLVTIPVVILTTSDSDIDILESYQLHAAGYIKKPVDFRELHDVLSKLEDYWFLVCKLANRG